MPDVALEPERPGSAESRARAFAGELQLFARRPEAEALAAHAREVLRGAFGGADPQRASAELGNAAWFAALSGPRQGFGRAPRTLELARTLLRALGWEPARTRIDVPRLRAVPSGGHRVPEAAAAYNPHRDTWYANPRAQLNLWLPVWDVPAEEAFGIWPALLAVPVPNGSAGFDYAAWKSSGGFQAYAQARPSEQFHPTVAPDWPRPAPLRLALPSGAALRFAGAHLHSTLPHDSGRVRYSVELRAVSLDDVEAGRGAPDPDNASRGSALEDYLPLG